MAFPAVSLQTDFRLSPPCEPKSEELDRKRHIGCKIRLLTVLLLVGGRCVVEMTTFRLVRGDQQEPRSSWSRLRMAGGAHADRMLADPEGKNRWTRLVAV